MEKSENIVVNAALDYAEKRGYSVIPINSEKKPFIQWTEFQCRKASAEEIKIWWNKWPNALIGIVTGEISGLFVVDCDSQEGFDAVQELLPDSLEIPTVHTPRGGWHFYFQYPADSRLTVKAGIMPGVDIRGEGGYIIASPSKNGNGKGYEWLKGLSLNECSPPPVPDALLSAFSNKINNYKYRECGLTRPQETTKTTENNIFYTQGRRDDDLFHAATCLVKGGGEIPFIQQTLDLVARNCKPPFPENEIKTKIDSALKRVEAKERNLTSEIREWIETTHGHFETTQVHRELHITTKREMKTCQMVLSRLCEGEKPLLERYGQKRGCYRRIENTLEPMDFLNAPTDEFPLALPLGVDNYCRLYPGNIIVIAGSKSAGKTAFLLNIVKDNMRRYEIDYFNSEMGDEKPIEYLTVEQQKENVAAIPERDRPIFKFGMEYGLRVQEARAIMKDTIKNGNIEIRRRFADNKLMEGTKTPLRKKKMRVLYLTTYAREIIKEVWNNDSPFLFTRADGKPYTNKDLNKIWHAACAVTGNHIKLYNALRHSLGCQLLDEGRTEHEVADILGHESTRMTRKYARRTVKKIGQILEMRRCGSVAVVSNEAK